MTQGRPVGKPAGLLHFLLIAQSGWQAKRANMSAGPAAAAETIRDTAARRSDRCAQRPLQTRKRRWQVLTLPEVSRSAGSDDGPRESRQNLVRGIPSGLHLKSLTINIIGLDTKREVLYNRKGRKRGPHFVCR